MCFSVFLLLALAVFSAGTFGWNCSTQMYADAKSIPPVAKTESSCNQWIVG